MLTSGRTNTCTLPGSKLQDPVLLWNDVLLGGGSGGCLTLMLTLGRTNAGTLLAYMNDGTLPESELPDTSKTCGCASSGSDSTPS